MKGRGYSFEYVKRYLEERGIEFKGYRMVIPAGMHIGIKTWGMIDFLKLPWHRRKAGEK